MKVHLVLAKCVCFKLLDVIGVFCHEDEWATEIQKITTILYVGCLHVALIGVLRYSVGLL